MQKIVFLQSLHTILKKKIRFDASQNVPTWRKQILAITAICFDASHNVPTYRENSGLAITSFVTSKLNLFWFIMEKTVFLQSLHIILEKKISLYDFNKFLVKKRQRLFIKLCSLHCSHSFTQNEWSWRHNNNVQSGWCWRWWCTDC